MDSDESKRCAGGAETRGAAAAMDTVCAADECKRSKAEPDATSAPAQRLGGEPGIDERDSASASARGASAASGGVLVRFTVTRTDASGAALSPPVPVAKQPKYKPPSLKALQEAWCAKRRSELLGRTSRNPVVGVEAMSPVPDRAVMVFSANNMLVECVHQAFYRHHPIRLSPDVIWLTIAQGLAAHVSRHSEKLRHVFVAHAGKKTLTVERADFVKGSPSNDWPGVFPEFSAQITEHIGEANRALIENDFSTTTATDRICSHITLMDTVQSYFEYEMLCGCGLPSVELTGTVDDWRSIRKRAAALSKLDLDWWLEALLPVLDQFVAAAEGRGAENRTFWNSMCNRYGASGFYGGPVSGWIQALFPYLADGEPNRLVGEWAKDSGELESPDGADAMDWHRRAPPRGTGVNLQDFPGSIACAPFKYKDVSTGLTHDMTFEAGVTCVVEHADAELCLEPRTGWAVLDRSRAAGKAASSASASEGTRGHAP